MCFFKVKHYFGHISGMVGPIDVKRKGSALVRYWVQYVTLTFDLTHYLDLGCFKVKFRNSSISGIVGLIDVKWKGSELIWYLADCMTLPFDHTHDLDLGVSRSESEKALSQEWGSRFTMNEKDVSHPFMTMTETKNLASSRQSNMLKHSVPVWHIFYDLSQNIVTTLINWSFHTPGCIQDIKP